jgi:hypothetical protein
LAKSPTICWVARILFSYFLVHILEEKLSYNLMLLFGYKRECIFKFFPFARTNFLSGLYLILREKICLLCRENADTSSSTIVFVLFFLFFIF